MDFSPFFISLKTAIFATVITFVLGILAARFVNGLKHGRSIADAVLSLPMVLPPTVTGFFLLILFGKNSAIGQFFLQFGISFIFTVKGAVIASVAVSFPLMYRTARGAFLQIDQDLIHAARTLGMSETKIFFKILIPNCMPGILAGTILAFTRALGEFGATIMIAGNLPGKTQTMSIAVYQAVQLGKRDLAYRWVAVILCLSFASMMVMNLIQTRQSKGGG